MSTPPSSEGDVASASSYIPSPPEISAEAGAVLPEVSTGSVPSSTDQRPARAVNWWEPTYVFFVTLIVLGLLTPRFTTFLDPVTGDEPFYLMTAISILKDGDLNECNNYRQRDEAVLHPSLLVEKRLLPNGWSGWMAVPYPLPPHPAKILPESRRCLGTNVKPLLKGIPGTDKPLPEDGTQSELYSKHGLGLSLLIALPFEFGGRTMVVLFLNILGALLAANIYLFAREATGKIWVGTLTWLAFTFTVPFLPYSFLIFPEMPAALLVVYAFRRVWLGQNNFLRLVAIGLCIAFLPWLHYRFIPVSATLFAFFAYRLFVQKSRTWDDRLKELSPLLAPIIISAIWLMAYFYFLYGHIWPNVDDHAGLNDFDGTLRGIAGSFLDAQWGLFVYAPIYILAIVGIILMATRRNWRADLLWIGVVFVPYFLIIANYAQWWGEWCPPARYLTSVLPLMGLPFAVALGSIRSWAYKGIFSILLLLSVVVVAGFVYQPRWMYNQPNGTSVLQSRALAEVITGLPPDLAIQVPDELQPYINTKIEDKREQLVVDTFGWFPTFVVPYFGYILEGKDSGDYWAEKAWERSVGSMFVIAFIVLVCVMLAAFEMRRTGRMVNDYGVSEGAGVQDSDTLTVIVPPEDSPDLPSALYVPLEVAERDLPLETQVTAQGPSDERLTGIKSNEAQT